MGWGSRLRSRATGFFNCRWASCVVGEKCLNTGVPYTVAFKSKDCYWPFLVIPITLGIGRGTALGGSSWRPVSRIPSLSSSTLFNEKNKLASRPPFITEWNIPILYHPNWAKNIPVFRVNEFGLKVQLYDLFRHLFRHTISYLISFPLTMGEGWGGGGRLEPFPPPGSSPTMGGGSYFFGSIGVRHFLNAISSGEG